MWEGIFLLGWFEVRGFTRGPAKCRGDAKVTRFSSRLGGLAWNDARKGAETQRLRGSLRGLAAWRGMMRAKARRRKGYAVLFAAWRLGVE
jgi:hypothetical protein